jgi:hypothetical protein
MANADGVMVSSQAVRYETGAATAGMITFMVDFRTAILGRQRGRDQGCATERPPLFLNEGILFSFSSIGRGRFILGSGDLVDLVTCATARTGHSSQLSGRGICDAQTMEEVSPLLKYQAAGLT